MTSLETGADGLRDRSRSPGRLDVQALPGRRAALQPAADEVLVSWTAPTRSPNVKPASWTSPPSAYRFGGSRRRPQRRRPRGPWADSLLPRRRRHPPPTPSRRCGAFSADPDLAALFGSYDDEPAAPNFLSQFKNLQHHYVHQHANEQAATFWGACGAIRAICSGILDGFDETYPVPSIEDIELGTRLHAGGRRIRLDKSLQVKHSSAGGPSACPGRRAAPGGSLTCLILRQGRMPNDLNLRWAGGWSVGAASVVLGALGAAGWWPALLLVAGLAAAALLAMNFPLYRFFYRRRGLIFTLAAVSWHWFYFLYGGAGFIAGLLVHLTAGLRKQPARPDAAQTGPKREAP